MKVFELIKELDKCPANHEVVFLGNNENGQFENMMDITTVGLYVDERWQTCIALW